MSHPSKIAKIERDMKNYGLAPELIGNFKIDCEEMMLYMYYPIKLAGDNHICWERRLEVFAPLIDKVLSYQDAEFFNDKYIYITAKHQFVTPDNPGNRPGWHSDGFMTDDLNFIWCDRFPTVFAVGNFNLDMDHTKSLIQMEEQSKECEIIEYQPGDLLALDEYVIHKTPEVPEVGGMRTFVKISVSKHRYNLKGNSINRMLGYDWTMYDRNRLRNHPTMNENDYVPEEFSETKEAGKR